MAQFNFAPFTTGLTIESIAGMLQKERSDILFVRDGIMYTAADLESLGLDKGRFSVDESCLNPEPTWTVSSIDPNFEEFWFFRKDVVEYLTGKPVEVPTK